MNEASPTVKVRETDRNREYWMSRQYVPENLRDSISRAQLLLVPQEGFGDYAGPVFPVQTEELFQFLGEHAPPNTLVDICISDDDYRELALHDATVIVATILVTSFIAPIAVNLISEYLKRNILAKSKKDTAEVRVRLLVDESDRGKHRTTEISYEGPVSAFEKTMRDQVQKLLPDLTEEPDD